MLSIITEHAPVGIAPTLEMSTRAEMYEMMREGRRPLLLSPARQAKVEFLRNVHSAPSALHEWWHILGLSQKPVQVRRDFVMFLEILQEMGIPLDYNTGKQNLVSNLLDGTLSIQEHGYYFKLEDLPPELQNRESLMDFEVRLRARLKGHPEADKILQLFQAYFLQELLD